LNEKVIIPYPVSWLDAYLKLGWFDGDLGD